MEAFPPPPFPTMKDDHAPVKFGTGTSHYPIEKGIGATQSQKQ